MNSKQPHSKEGDKPTTSKSQPRKRQPPSESSKISKANISDVSSIITFTNEDSEEELLQPRKKGAVKYQAPDKLDPAKLSTKVSALPEVSYNPMQNNNLAMEVVRLNVSNLWLLKFATFNC